MKADDVEDIRRLKRPSFVYIPSLAKQCLVADLDRIMTVEKAVLASCVPSSGTNNDKENRDFGAALARKWSRMAFPDDFVIATKKIRARFLGKHGKDSAEGAHLRALREIRVSAAPSWNDEVVRLTWWLIRQNEPEGFSANWNGVMQSWMSLFDSRGRFEAGDWFACRLDDLTARDYVESDKLDLDQLSYSK